MTNAPPNAVIAAATPPATLAALLARLHPVPCGHELIRVGSAHDGGYLIPDDLGGIAMCFSPGVSTNADFETDLFQRSGIPSALADGSVDGPPPGSVFHSFEKRFLGSSRNGGFMRLEDWVTRHGPDDLPGGPKLMIPHPLDAPCLPDKPELPLPPCWQAISTAP